MSTTTLQRVVVRMLYDPIFAQAVYGDVSEATRGLDLSSEMRGWLIASDPRAYRVDPMRRSRSLTALIEEYLVSVAMISRAEVEKETSAFLDSFFSSAHFHADLQEGTSLAASFGKWLGLRGRGTDVVRLEQEMAVARRTFEAGASDVGRRIALAPGVRVLRVSAGTVTFFSEALAILRQDPRGVHEAALDRLPTLPPIPTEADLEGVLIDGHAGAMTLETLSLELAQVLTVAAFPIDFDAFVQAASESGADRQDCIGIVESFAEDGILVGSPAP